MPTTRRTHSVEVHTVGEWTLDELEDFCAAARRAQIPGSTVAVYAGAAGAGRCLAFAHDYAANPPAPSDIRPPAPHPGEAVTERLELSSSGRPDLRDLR